MRKQRPGFKTTSTTCLCSAHFKESCLHENQSIVLKVKCQLNIDAVPTIDVAGIGKSVNDEMTDGE